MVTQRRPELPEGLPRQPGHRAGAAPRPRLGHHRRREDRAARQRRAVPQPARQRERPRRDGEEPAGAEHAEHHLRDDGHAARGRRAGRILEPPERRLRHRARRQDAEELQLLVGVQREIGWGTVLDVTYAGFQMRNGEMDVQHQPGARRRAVRRRQPAERATRRTRRPPSRTSSCARTSATRTSRSARTSAPASYNSLQVQLNRRYISGLQFAVAYTLGEDRQRRQRPINTLRPGRRRGTRGPTARPSSQPRRQLHVGRAERQPAVEQRARPAACSTAGSSRATPRSSAATGPARRTSTTDNFDFTGGDGGTRPRGSTGDAVLHERQLRSDARRHRQLSSTSRRSAG